MFCVHTVVNKNDDSNLDCTQFFRVFQKKLSFILDIFQQKLYNFFNVGYFLLTNLYFFKP